MRHIPILRRIGTPALGLPPKPRQMMYCLPGSSFLGPSPYTKQWMITVSFFPGRRRIFTGPLLERAGGGVISKALEPAYPKSRTVRLRRLCVCMPFAILNTHRCFLAARPQGKPCRELPDHDENKHMRPACLALRSHRTARKENPFFLRSGSHCAAGMQFVSGFLFCSILSSALPLAHVLEATR
jgi:hypothetical protein